MPEPTRINPNTGAIYSADLMYEQNCKCGTTEVIVTEEQFDYSTKGDYGWKMVCVVNNTIIESVGITNMSAADCLKLESITWSKGEEIVGNIATFNCTEGGWIVYKDCKLS
tara:strand:- start:29 stop:361 length:333 start_codon:yes stop_codon:yes gene_type:complete